MRLSLGAPDLPRDPTPNYPDVGLLAGGSIPRGYRHFHHRVEVGPADPDRLQAAGESLLRWELHRRAGFGIEANGPATLGSLVTVHVGVGPVRIPAPCQVLDATRTDTAIGFTYGTLLGHPECGEERFGFTARGGRLVFEVEAASRPSSRLRASLLGPAQHLIQDVLTRRYLRAAAAGSALGN